MNSKEYFRKLEDKYLRGDSYEGAHSIKNIGPGKFRIEGIEQEFRFQVMHLPTLRVGDELKRFHFDLKR